MRSYTLKGLPCGFYSFSWSCGFLICMVLNRSRNRFFLRFISFFLKYSSSSKPISSIFFSFHSSNFCLFFRWRARSFYFICDEFCVSSKWLHDFRCKWMWSAEQKNLFRFCLNRRLLTWTGVPPWKELIGQYWILPYLGTTSSTLISVKILTLPFAFFLILSQCRAAGNKLWPCYYFNFSSFC